MQQWTIPPSCRKIPKKRMMKAAEKKVAATQLQQLHHLKFSTLNQLAAGTAHEFNNLIAGILGSAEIISLELPASHPARESLNHIFEASHRARDFVIKLRDLGQRNLPDHRPIRLQSLIAETLPILRTIIASKVKLETQIAADCPPVLADASQIQQALIELCLQSWHGLPERTGEITIALESISVGEKFGLLEPGHHVRLTVRDNSPGLDKNSLEKIFDPFHLRRSNGKKIGLELFLVRETMHIHQGEIIAASEPGHGLAFHLYFPAATGN